MDNSGKNLLALINEILDISKIEAGKMDLVLVDFNLTSMIADLDKMFQLRCREKNLGFTFSKSLRKQAGNGPSHKRHSFSNQSKWQF